jgi:hypothetical protein
MLVYEPSKPNSMSSTEGDFTPTASMASSGEKLGMDPQISQPLCCGLCREPFCEHWLCPSLLTASQKIAIRGPREICMVDGHMRTEHGKHVACWSGFPL